MAEVREGTCRPRLRVDETAKPGSVESGSRNRSFGFSSVGLYSGDGSYGGKASGQRLFSIFEVLKID